jgi:hypothetical protein
VEKDPSQIGKLLSAGSLEPEKFINGGLNVEQNNRSIDLSVNPLTLLMV